MQLKKISILLFLFFYFFLPCMSNEIKYPIVYIPGMFDNGDLLIEDSKLIYHLNDAAGFYHQHYFNDQYRYDQEPIDCSSAIINAKFQSTSIANLLGLKRVNISLWKMTYRLYCFLAGNAPRFINYKNTVNYEGNDFSGFCVRDEKKIYYQGLIGEIWAKYGKKVYYKQKKTKNILTFPQETSKYPFYTNENGYFDHPDQIKFNFIVHSSGGLALRKFIQLYEKTGRPCPVNSIVNLSVPQQGARMLYSLKPGFRKLLKNCINNINEQKEKVVLLPGNEFSLTYQELIEKTHINFLHGDQLSARLLRKIISAFIIYGIPFDGEKGVLGHDPALRTLHPESFFIKSLHQAKIPDSIRIHNYRVVTPYAPIYETLGKHFKLEKHDGVVDYRDTGLEFLSNYSKLFTKDYIIHKANHIPFPKIEPLFNLRTTLKQFYPFLKVIVKVKGSKEDQINYIEAFFRAVMQEMNFDLDYYLEHEDYSVIDYFAGQPVLF